MPTTVEDIRVFIELASRKDIKTIVIKTNAEGTKFKLRGQKSVYTLNVQNAERAAKIRQSLPPSLEIIDISKKVK